MNLESRIEKLEARQRVIEDENAPAHWQHADRDDDGHVIACERLAFSLEPAPLDQSPMVHAFKTMTRELFSRTACHYSECDHRETCRADGSPTSWGKRKLESAGAT